MFLPERPYLPPGTLREVLLRTGRESQVADADVAAVLRALELDAVVARVGGLDVERDWDDVLSLSEQQLFAAARILLAKSPFAVLQNLRTTLAPEQVERVLALCSAASIAVLAFGTLALLPETWDAVLELRARGDWGWRASRRGVE
jgi:putative ATP-binding cassette transporter